MIRSLATLAAAVAVLVLATGYRLPPEPPVAIGTGEGADLVTANCSGCHSLDYIVRQPPAMGQGFWAAEVTKMRTVYGAPVSEEDASRIAAYLAALKLPAPR